MAPLQRMNALSVRSVNEVAAIGIGAGTGGIIMLAALALLMQICFRRWRFKRQVVEIGDGIRPIQGPTTAFSRRKTTKSWSKLPVIPNARSRPAALAGPVEARRGSNPVQVQERPRIPHSRSEECQSSREATSPPKQTRFREELPPAKRRRFQKLPAIFESPNNVFKSPKRATPGKRKSSPESACIFEVTPSAPPIDADDASHSVGAVKKRQCPSRHSSSGKPYDVHPWTLVPDTDRPKPGRSISVGLLVDVNHADVRSTFRPGSEKIHVRSISCGAHPLLPPPTGPLPPLPAVARGLPQHKRSSSVSVTDEDNSALLRSRQKAYADLVGRHIAYQDLIKESANAHRHNERGTGHRSVSAHQSRLSYTSIESECNSLQSIAPSLVMVGSRLSVPRIATADTLNISRVSSMDSFQTYHSSVVISTPRLILTPRPKSGTRVSASGSPAERHRTPVLRPISGNVTTPLSQTEKSGRESGDSISASPFNWDPVIPRPRYASLKTSPSSRSAAEARKGHKGHKRQNCVRISRRPPTILGPSSRSTSPSLEEILEESPYESIMNLHTVAAPHPDLRPPAQAQLRPVACSDPVKLRASLTPSSPTFSLSRFDQDFAPSALRPNMMKINGPTLSCSSSLFSIPTLPSPGDLSMSADVEHPAPELTLTRPSFDVDHTSDDPPFAIHGDDDEIIFAVDDCVRNHGAFSANEYDPDWRYRNEVGTTAYNPSSPLVAYHSSHGISPPCSEVHQSSPLPAMHQLFDHDADRKHSSPPVSPKTRPTSMPSSPPILILDALRSHHQFSPASLDPHDENWIALSDSPRSDARRSPSRCIQSPLRWHPPHGRSLLSPSNEHRPSTPQNHGMSLFPAFQSFSESSENLLQPDEQSCTEQINQSPLHPHENVDGETRPTTSMGTSHSPSPRIPSPLRPAPHPPISSRSSSTLTPRPHIPTTQTHQRTPSSIMGPRSAPGQDIRCSIKALRRMNSELVFGDSGEGRDQVVGGQRKFLNLGREGSPVLPLWTEVADCQCEDHELEGEGSIRDEGSRSGQTVLDEDHSAYTGKITNGLTEKENTAVAGLVKIHGGFDFGFDPAVCAESALAANKENKENFRASFVVTGAGQDDLEDDAIVFEDVDLEGSSPLPPMFVHV